MHVIYIVVSLVRSFPFFFFQALLFFFNYFKFCGYYEKRNKKYVYNHITMTQT